MHHIHPLRKAFEPDPRFSGVFQTDDFELDQQVENNGVPFVESDDHGETGVPSVDLPFRIHDEDDVVTERRQMYKVPVPVCPPL